MSGKDYLKIRLTTQQLSFLISNILCKIVVNDLLNNQNILKDIFEDKRGQRRENVKIRSEFFESWNGTIDFLLWNSEQGSGEWLLFRKWCGTFYTSKWFFFWMRVLWLPDSDNDLEHSLQGRRRRFFFKWLLPRKGFSPKMASPRKWLLPRKFKIHHTF